MIEIRRPLVASVPGILGEQLEDEQAPSPNVHEVLGHRLHEGHVESQAQGSWLRVRCLTSALAPVPADTLPRSGRTTSRRRAPWDLWPKSALTR